MELRLSRFNPSALAAHDCDGCRIRGQPGRYCLRFRSRNRLRALDLAARAEVRTGITLGKRGPEGIPTAYFGDIIANLYALDATTGELVWQTSPDDHHSATLTGTPAFANGICTYRSHRWRWLQRLTPTTPAAHFEDTLWR
ncbi:MAG: hypothetical protein CM15mP84_05690 [Cellvibrionales bacterium]|nr:MAG: hypothetical protein CM15mP84_05690 [Cellvibrionales bacterium]